MSVLIIDTLLVLLGIPVLVFVIECLLGLLGRQNGKEPDLPEDLRTAILIPAHNEEAVIIDTLLSVRDQLNAEDCVVVVADNCNDKTAAIVREFGFIALERHNEDERGKGYALDCGLTFLKQRQRRPNIVIIVDADCLLADQALAHLKQQVLDTKAPAQACYLMQRGELERIGLKVSEFAFMVKNKVRLQGLARLGMPVPLTGTGMAFPFEALADVNLATGDIVEDMRLGVELAEKDMGAQFCAQAQVYSYFPSTEAAEKTQRERWEHGHLSTIKQFAPRLLKRAISKPSLKAMVMMLDLLVPPLSLLVMLIAAALTAASVWGHFFNDWIHAKILGGYFMLLMLTILMTWYIYGRKILSLGELAHIPVYIVSKIFLYAGYLVRKQTAWIRTDRQ